MRRVWTLQQSQEQVRSPLFRMICVDEVREEWDPSIPLP